MKSNYTYILKCHATNGDESFFKVGVSNNPFRRCYNISLSSKGKYIAQPIARKFFKNETYGSIRAGSSAYQLEKEIKKHINTEGLKYQPKHSFSGSSECFQTTSIDELINQFLLVKFVEEQQSIIVSDSYLIVTSNKGVWKTNRNSLASKNGVLGVLHKEKDKKAKNDVLANYYDSIDLVLTDYFSELDLIAPQAKYKSIIQKLPSINNNY